MRIVFDLDSVLCDLTTEWTRVYNERFNDNLDRNDITDWEIRKFIKPEAYKEIFKIINEVGFYKRVKPNEYFVEMARDMMNIRDEISVCTSCSNNPTMISEKVKWLKKHTPFISQDNFIFVNNKGNANGDLLVDDRPKNIEDFLLANHGSKGYLVFMAHNRESRKGILSNPLFKGRIMTSGKEF